MVAHWAQPHPAAWVAMLVAMPLVVFSWCFLPNHEMACVVVALSMPVVVPLVIHRRLAAERNSPMGWPA